MAENNITQLQEELADLKSTKFSLEKVSSFSFKVKNFSISRHVNCFSVEIVEAFCLNHA